MTRLDARDETIVTLHVLSHLGGVERDSRVEIGEGDDQNHIDNVVEQKTVITNTEFSGYYNNEKIFTLNKDETQTKKTTVDGELTIGKTKFIPMADTSQGLNIVILD